MAFVKHQKITIVIINYYSSRYLPKLIHSIDRYISNFVKEIIIVNNSPDDHFNLSLQKDGKIKVLQSSTNLGFAKAVNWASKNTKSDFILLLNPDTFLIDNSTKQLIQDMERDEKIGAIGGSIYNINNKKSLTANSYPTFLIGLFEFTNLKRIFPNNPFTNKFWIEKVHNITKKIEVTSLCGAYLLFRKNINTKPITFDENYFLYLEDLDFGISINKLGYKVIFEPKARVIHIGGASSNSIYNTVLKHWYNSRKYFFLKNISRPLGYILYIIFDIEEILLRYYHLILHEPTD